MKKGHAKVTILLPVYNGEMYLSECLQSLIGQTFPDFELLIINDGSTDATMDIIRSVNDRRIRCLENKRNHGLISALNRGMHQAKGEYVMRMDADDVAMPDRMERQLTFMEGTDADIVGTNALELSTDQLIAYPADAEGIKIQMLLNNCIIHPTVMFRKKSLTENQLYYSTDALYAEDYKLWVDAVLGGLVVVNMPEPLIRYRFHQKQVSAVKRIDQHIMASRIRLVYGSCIFPDLIAGRGREYLHLLFPSAALLEENPAISGKLHQLADLLISHNNESGFLEADLFEEFIINRLSTIKLILDEKSVPPMNV